MPCTPASLTRSLHPTVRTTVADVAVIGGDAIGAATAWLLARRGARVVLLEERGARAVRHAARGTAWSAHPTWMHAEARRRLGPATELWRALEAETGATLLHRADALDHGGATATLEALADRHPAADTEWLTADAAAARWPGSRFTGPVLRRRGAAVQIHADHAIAALTAAATGQGALLWHRTPVQGVDVADSAQVEIRTRAGRVCAGSVVVTGSVPAGLTAGLPDAPGAGGQELHFTASAGGPDTAGWPLIAHHHGELGLVRAAACTRGHLAVGCGGGSPEDLREYVRDWFPALAEQRPEPVAQAAMSTALAPVSIGHAGPVLTARCAGIGSVLATAVGEVLADAALNGAAAPGVTEFV